MSNKIVYIETIHDWSIINDFTELALHQFVLAEQSVSKEIISDILQTMSRLNICFKQPKLCYLSIIEEEHMSEEEHYYNVIMAANIAIGALMKYIKTK